jgi:opacity protein-like surface antigen
MIEKNKSCLGICAAALLLLPLLLPNVAGAERFADLAVGFSFTQDETMRFSSNGDSESQDLSFESAGTFGYRMGYWFERLPYLALALEVDYTGIENEGAQEIAAFSFSPLIMFRLQFNKNKIYPRGEWLPFIAAGPGLIMSEIEYEVSDSPVPDLIDSPTLTGKYEDKQFDVGLDLRAGIKKMVNPKWAVNLEYRFLYFEPQYEDNVMGNTVKTDIDLYTHSLMLGVAYNF